MSERVVVDPNVLISAFLLKESKPGQVVQDIEAGRLVFIASRQIFREVAAALEKPYFTKRSTPGDRAAWVAALWAKAEMHPDPSRHRPITRDPNDDYLVQLYREHDAGLLISGDPDLLEVRLPDLTVISPARYVEIRETGRRGDLL